MFTDLDYNKRQSDTLHAISSLKAKRRLLQPS